VRVGGAAVSGATGQVITEILWDWGDGVYEAHAFPNTHTYSGSGTYTVTVRATQTDGRSTQKTTVVYVNGPTEATTAPTTSSPATAQTTAPTTEPPTIPAGAPVIALNQPTVENQTVVIGGSIQPGGPGVVVDAIEWDWGDETRIRSNDIPATHSYTAAGSYTITITAFQSDGQTATSTYPISIIQVPQTYVTTGTPMPNGSGFPIPAIHLFGINILPIILMLMVGLIVGGLLYMKNRQSEAPAIPTTDPIEQAAGAYQVAREQGDLPAAKRHALDAARLLVIQAEAVPRYRDAYLEKAEIWKEIARSIEDQPLQNGPDPFEAVVPASFTPVPSEETAPPSDLERDEAPRTGGDLLAGTDVEPAVFDAVLRVALEIAREGREGKPVGTAFLVGDVDGVLAYSTQFILNPFKGHTTDERRITDDQLAENIKEFAQLDGAFVIGGDGLVEAAGRYITVDTSAVQIPPGLGSRHASVAGITLVTGAIGIVVSQSGGLIKVFRGGEIVRTVSPW